MRRAETISGAPCIRGHVGERYKNNGECIECRKARDARPAAKQARARRDAASPDRVVARVRKYQATQRGRAVRLFHSARSRCELVTITPEWIEDRLHLGSCEISGLPFEFATTKMQGPFSPSLDRIDRSAGYTPDNTRVILWALNAAFSHWGEDAFRAIATAWVGRSAAPLVEGSHNRIGPKSHE